MNELKLKHNQRENYEDESIREEITENQAFRTKEMKSVKY